MSCDFLAEVRAAVERHGARDFRLTLLSGPGIGRKAARSTFRVDGADGAVIKARRIESAAAAEHLAALRAVLDPAFAPVIARHGSVLLEEWIPGETLTEPAAAERAEAIGALLGRLHATPARTLLAPASTAEARQRATRELEELARVRVVTGGEAQALHDRLAHDDPGTTPQTVVHLDFCPENLVGDRAGRLFSIDNEWICHGPPGADLGRMYARWPMAGPVWRRVLRGYAAAAPGVPAALAFWQVVMAIWSATLRLPRAPAALAGPTALLRRLAAGDTGSEDGA